MNAAINLSGSAWRPSPRVAAYLASLPAGLDSYPNYRQKGSVVRTFLEGTPLLRDTLALPPELRELAGNKPLATSWVPEVHATALYLTLADLHYANAADFLAYCTRRNAELLRGPMYRAILTISSPGMILQALRAGWPLFHKGMTLTVVETGPGRARLRLVYAPGLLPELIARAQGTAFYVAAEATRVVRDCTSELVDFRRDAATYEIAWTT